MILLSVCSFFLFDTPEVLKSENFEVSRRQLVSDRVHSWDGFPGNLNISVVMTFNVSLLRRSELVLIPFRNAKPIFAKSGKRIQKIFQNLSFSVHELDGITGKLIQLKFMSAYSFF